MFGSEFGVFGGEVTECWREITNEEMPKFVDVLVRRDGDDLRSALLIEVKYRIDPENPDRAFCKNAIRKAIKQIDSTREILKDSSDASDSDYESLILIPEKYRSVNSSYFKDLSIQRHGFPKHTEVKSLKQLVREKGV